MKIYKCDIHNTRKSDRHSLTTSHNDSPKSSPLVQLDMLKDLLELNQVSTYHYIFRSDGVILGCYGHSMKNPNHIQNNDKNKPKIGNIRIRRPLLKKIMIDKLQHNTIQYNKKLITLEIEDVFRNNNCIPKIHAPFHDGIKESFDL